MRRKHRVVVEITFEEPCTAKVAAGTVRHLMNEGIEQDKRWLDTVTKFECKQFGRVAQGLELRERPKGRA